MIHPLTELRLVSATIGYGVFATAFIPEGTIVYVAGNVQIRLCPSLQTKSCGEFVGPHFALLKYSPLHPRAGARETPILIIRTPPFLCKT